MRLNLYFSALTVSALAVVSLAPASAQSAVSAVAGVKAAPYADAAPHQSKFVQVNGLKLNYLDYGGKLNPQGVAVVMLPGLNDTAHIYDDLAPRLAGPYPIYALTRRGCGDSGKSPGGDYSNAARVEDVAGFLDALQIKKVILIGHSLAGDELTGFAAKYPARVAALVYLEAAYDRSQGPFAAIAQLPPDQVAKIVATSPVALADIAAYRAHSKQITEDAWNSAAEANMQDRIAVQPDGTVVEKSAPDVTAKLLIATATLHPDESQVKAPALCLFGTFSSAADMEKQGIPAAQATSANDWQKNSEEAARTRMHAQVIAYPPDTSHYLFIQYPERTAGEIKSFLATPAVQAQLR